MERPDENLGVGVELTSDSIEEKTDHSKWDQRTRHAIKGDLDGGETRFAPTHTTSFVSYQEQEISQVVVLPTQLNKPTSQEGRKLIIQNICPRIASVRKPASP